MLKSSKCNVHEHKHFCAGNQHVPWDAGDPIQLRHDQYTSSVHTGEARGYHGLDQWQPYSQNNQCMPKATAAGYIGTSHRSVPVPLAEAFARPLFYAQQ